MTDALLQQMRLGRKTAAALKLQLSSLITRNSDSLVFVLEGKTDVGPYEVWISRVDDTLHYQFLVAEGKTQILECRKNIRTPGFLGAERVYFFIDRDFDGLRDETPGPDLFCTNAYSIENYLVQENVLRSILHDELECPVHDGSADRPLELYRSLLDSLLQHLLPINKLLFVCQVFGIQFDSAKDIVGGYLRVQLTAVEPYYDASSLCETLSLAREPTSEELEVAEGFFASNDLLQNCRGKLLLSFFLKWLDLLINERIYNKQSIFPSGRKVKASTQHFKLRSLATRAPVPDELRQFLASLPKHLLEDERPGGVLSAT